MVAPSTDILGGQAVQAARLLECLQSEPSLSISFLPVNPRLPGALGSLQKIKYLRTVVTSLCYFWLLLARVRKYDVIHIFSASYLSFLLAPTPAILVARLYGRRTILNYRSGEAEDHLTRWRSARATIRQVDQIVVCSGYLVEIFSRFGFAAYGIPNIVQLDRFVFRERNPLRPVFLCNRNFESHYNVACVLRAFAIIQRRHENAKLTLAGDGKERASLEKLAQELDLRNVDFVGAVPPEQMPELYAAADIFLNGSDIDNMPTSLIESFAAGLPVVTTDAGGIPYIVTDGATGLLVSKGDYESMAAAALRLLAEPAFASGIANNAYRECQKYAWDSVRDEWLKLYREQASRPD
jgi:glycosyltransferase involved in cell wall biosynthesis